MITTELLEFVKSHIEKETPDHEVHTLLADHGGWRKEDIEEAFLIARFGYPANQE